MNLSSDTPPDGDFARYIEQLMSANAAKVNTGVRDDLLYSPAPSPRLSGKKRAARAALPPSSGDGPPGLSGLSGTPALSGLSGLSTSSGASGSPVYSASLTGKTVARHLKGLLYAWIGLQLLGLVWRGATGLLVPLLLAYAAWGVLKLRRQSPGGLTGALQAWAQKISGQRLKP